MTHPCQVLEDMSPKVNILYKKPKFILVLFHKVISHNAHHIVIDHVSLAKQKKKKKKKSRVTTKSSVFYMALLGCHKGDKRMKFPSTGRHVTENEHTLQEA